MENRTIKYLWDSTILAVSGIVVVAGVVLGTLVYKERSRNSSTNRDLSFLNTSEVSLEDRNTDGFQDIVIQSERGEFVYYGIGDNKFLSKWKILEKKESELEIETKRTLQELNALYAPKQTSE